MEERTKLINRTIEYLAERKCISIDDVTDEMIMLELADEVVKNCSIPDVGRKLPVEFLQWYSGMEEQKILNAFERWKKEKG